MLAQLEAKHPRSEIQKICQKLRTQITPGEIIDQSDLIAFTNKFDNAQKIAELLSEIKPGASSNWALPLLKKAYEACGIESASRNIFILPALSPYDYAVHIDILRYLGTDHQKIDLFRIPHCADFDIASIAITGHEIGHILCQLNGAAFQPEIDSYIAKITPSVNKGEQFALTKMAIDTKKGKMIASHVQEHLCDLIGSAIFGPVFDLALIRTFSSINPTRMISQTHPRELYRIFLAYTRLQDASSHFNRHLKPLQALAKDIESIYSTSISSYIPSKEESDLFDLANKIFESILNKNIQKFDFVDAFNRVANELNSLRPPCETVNEAFPQPISPIEIAFGTALYYYGSGYKSGDFYTETVGEDKQKKEILYGILIKHMRYAIGISELVTEANMAFKSSPDFENKIDQLRGTLWEMRSTEKDDSLVITPSIWPTDQYTVSSVDLRLGSTFLVSRVPNYTHITPHRQSSEGPDETSLTYKIFERIELVVGQEFILHPHQFVLACTLEYISLPSNLSALVLGRSSWGRLGLTIATATAVQPGFRGCLTLELRNLGETPLPLIVGSRVAQISIIPTINEITSAGHEYYVVSSKYIGPVSVEPPKIQKDNDWTVLDRFINR